MAHTTTDDFAAHTGLEYSAEQIVRLWTLIGRAERMITRRLGVDFFVPGDELLAPEDRAVASQDWIEATSIITEFLFLNDTPDAREDTLGPYKSERIGDYSYTLRDKRDEIGVFSDATLKMILATYRTNREGPGYATFTTAGPAFDVVETTEVP